MILARCTIRIMNPFFLIFITSTEEFTKLQTIYRYWDSGEASQVDIVDIDQGT